MPSYFLPVDESVFSFPRNLNGFAVRWKNDQIGWGLFADKPFKKGEIIGVYGGAVQRLFPGVRYDRAYTAELLRPFLWIFPYVVDAKDVGNVLRYINHSRKPNLGVLFVRYCSLPFLCFVAERSIANGEELLISYGKSFWKTGRRETAL